MERAVGVLKRKTRQKSSTDVEGGYEQGRHCSRSSRHRGRQAGVKEKKGVPVHWGDYARAERGMKP